MTRRILTALARAARENWSDSSGHFHQGTSGIAYRCTDPSCTRHRG